MENIAEGPEACEAGRATTVQSGGPRKPGGAITTAVPGGAEVARNHCGTDRSKDQGGVTGKEVLG